MKRIGIAGIVVAGVMVLAGCAGDDTTGASTSASASTTPQSTISINSTVTSEAGTGAYCSLLNEIETEGKKLADHENLTDEQALAKQLEWYNKAIDAAPASVKKAWTERLELSNKLDKQLDTGNGEQDSTMIKRYNELGETILEDARVRCGEDFSG